MRSNINNPEFWLAILVGLTLAIGIAPSAYYVYFEQIGWPHPYITHNGPLWGTFYSDLLCLGNAALLIIFPIVTLALKRQRIKRDFLSYLYFVLPFAQFVAGLLNVIFLLALLD